MTGYTSTTPDNGAANGYADIVSTMKKYFLGFYDSNADLLAEAFHPASALFYVDGQCPKKIEIAQYLEIVRSRKPISLDPKVETIQSISFVSPTMALVRASIANENACFDDCLTLVFDGSQWRIISKSYAARPKAT